MYQDLKNKVAVVTGARRGMGRAHALKLAQSGAKVVVSDIDQADCEKVVKEIKSKKGQAIAIKCDVSKKSEVDQMIEKTIKEFGRLDVLVNNAGIADFKPFLEMTEQDWDRTIDINLKGYFLCAQAAAREMAKNKKGVIVNIASIAMGQQGIGYSTLAHYCASKGGIVAMTEALAVELASLGIRVNAVCPGMIDTPMVEPLKSDKKAMQGTLARIPLRRAGRPEEVSNMVAFLASDESSYMTGSAVIIDGGWMSG